MCMTVVTTIALWTCAVQLLTKALIRLCGLLYCLDSLPLVTLMNNITSMKGVTNERCEISAIPVKDLSIVCELYV